MVLKDIPDDTLLVDVIPMLHGFARGVLERSSFKTVGDVRKASDVEIFQIHNCGKKTLAEIRGLFGRDGQCAETRPVDVLLVSMSIDRHVTTSKINEEMFLMFLKGLGDDEIAELINMTKSNVGQARGELVDFVEDMLHRGD